MKQVIVFAIAILICTSSFAQKHGRHEDPILSHAKELNLSPDQSAKLTALSKEHRIAMQSLRKNDSIAAADKQQKMHDLQKNYRESTKAILTAEQYAKLGDFRRDSTGDKSKNLQKAALKKELGLTEEQTAKLKAMEANDRSKIEQIQKDTSITGANKKFRIEELKKQRRQELESILTPEQQKKYKEMQIRKKDHDLKQ